jgi:PAS domain-containing protein
MSSPKAIQMILARQLASCVATPILLVDTAGTLVFYNEPAEDILDQRFEETGEIPADEWNDLVTVADEDRNPLPPDERPMRAALLSRQPVSRRMWSKHRTGPWQRIQVTAIPLVGEGDHLLGVMNVFWIVE